MMKLFTFLLLFAILMMPASAENVTIEIFENSAGVYYISINDGEIIECGETCEVEIDNVTGTNTSTTITKEDINRIAKQVSVEMYGEEDAFNTTEFSLVVSDVVKGSDKDLMDWIKKTYMPTVEEHNNCTTLLAEKENALKVLNAQFKGYDDEIKAKNSELDTIKKNLDLYWYIILILLTTSFILLIVKTDLIRAIREQRSK